MSQLIAAVFWLAGTSGPSYSCVPSEDGKGWDCREGERAPERPVVFYQERPLVDDPWLTPRLTPLQPETILKPQDWFDWHFDPNPGPLVAETTPSRARSAATGDRQVDRRRQPQTAAPADAFWVQLLSASKPQSVDAVVAELTLDVDDLSVHRDSASGLWQLLLGPFPTLREADAARQQLPPKYHDAFVRRGPQRPPATLAEWRRSQTGR